MRCAGEGAIYVELTASPDHARLVGLTDEEHVDGIARGIDDARDEAGIEGRILISCVRNFGVEPALSVARYAAERPHPVHRRLLDGGRRGELPARRLRGGVRDRRRTPGSAAPSTPASGPAPRASRAASSCRSRRIAHGVRSIEDPALVEELAERGIFLECCPTSNVVLGIYPSYEEHPLPRLREAGVRVTLGSDDPPYFGASIGGEYEICRRALRLRRRRSESDHGDRHRGRILRRIAQTALKRKRCRVAQSLTQRGDSTVRKSFRFTLFALLAALALGIAACGGDDDDSGGSSSSTTRATAAARPSRPAS